MSEIAKIVERIAVEESIDIILSDEQYFLASDTIDISGYIYNDLNNHNINLQLSEYE